MDKETGNPRRSSILKSRKLLGSADADNETDTLVVKLNRRVSFASSSTVKLFATDLSQSSEVTDKDNIYNEEVVFTDSSQSSKNSSSDMELTDVQIQRKIEMFEDVNVSQNLPPELQADKENLVTRKRTFLKTTKESPMEKRSAFRAIGAENAELHLHKTKVFDDMDMDFTQPIHSVLLLERRKSLAKNKIGMERTGESENAHNKTCCKDTDMEFTEQIPNVFFCKGENCLVMNNMTVGDLDFIVPVGGIIQKTEFENEEIVEEAIVDEQTEMSLNETAAVGGIIESQKSDVNSECLFAASVPPQTTNTAISKDHVLEDAPKHSNKTVHESFVNSKSDYKTIQPCNDMNSNMQHSILVPAFTSSSEVKPLPQTKTDLGISKPNHLTHNAPSVSTNTLNSEMQPLAVLQRSSNTHNFLRVPSSFVPVSRQKKSEDLLNITPTKPSFANNTNLSDTMKVSVSVAPQIDTSVNKSKTNNSSEIIPPVSLNFSASVSPQNKQVVNSAPSLPNQMMSHNCLDVSPLISFHISASVSPKKDIKNATGNAANSAEAQHYLFPPTSFNVDVDTDNTTNRAASSPETQRFPPVSLGVNITPSKTSVSISMSPQSPISMCTMEDTELLLACNLSRNATQPPSSEYSKIMAGDYDPSPANSKLLALSDIGSATLPNYIQQPRVSLMVDDVTDDVLLQDSVSGIEQFDVGDATAGEILEKIPDDPLNLLMENLVKIKKEEPPNSEEFEENCRKWRSLNEEIEIVAKQIMELVSLEEEESRYSTESELNESSKEKQGTRLSCLDSTDEMEETLSIVRQIEERARANKHYYKVTDLRNASCTIHTLFGNIKTDVKFDTLTGRIEGINITTRMKENWQAISKYVAVQFDKQLSPHTLPSFLGQHYDVLSLLDYIQVKMRYFMQLLDEHDQLVKEYNLRLDENLRATLTIFSVELEVIWEVKVNFLDTPLSEDSVEAKAKLGYVNEKAVKRCINGCPQGFAVFNPFIANIKSYMSTLKPRKNF